MVDLHHLDVEGDESSYPETKGPQARKAPMPRPPNSHNTLSDHLPEAWDFSPSYPVMIKGAGRELRFKVPQPLYDAMMSTINRRGSPFESTSHFGVEALFLAGLVADRQLRQPDPNVTDVLARMESERKTRMWLARLEEEDEQVLGVQELLTSMVNTGAIESALTELAWYRDRFTRTVEPYWRARYLAHLDSLPVVQNLIRYQESTHARRNGRSS
jgi:hypothetical protein